MPIIGFQRSAYRLEFRLKADSFFQKSRIYSINQKQFEKIFPWENEMGTPIEKNESEFGYLIIDSTYELESYDSHIQGAAKIRPDILIILGILSFVTGEVFIPANSFTASHSMVANHIQDETENSTLECNKHRLSNFLTKVLNQIKVASFEKKVLCFTIFERFRKALYLEKESEDNDIFIDESVLAYMHILEVLSDEFKDELNEENGIKRTVLSKKIISYAKENNSQSKEIIRLINTWDNTRVSLKSKIFHLLSTFNLDNIKSKAIVERFIEHRNGIAHGRKNLYQEKLVFPLPQFFSFIKDIDEDVELIKILAARCIAKFLTIDLWKTEWEFKLQTEFMPLDVVKEFVKNFISNEKQNQTFLRKGLNDIYLHTLTYYYRKNKLSFLQLENTIGDIIIKCKKAKYVYQRLFEASVILADSSKSGLAKKSKKIVSDVYHNKWNYHSNIRDVIKEYQYHGKELVWYEAWLKDGKRKL